jgi:hypothetical protein
MHDGGGSARGGGHGDFGGPRTRRRGRPRSGSCLAAVLFLVLAVIALLVIVVAVKLLAGQGH